MSVSRTNTQRKIIRLDPLSLPYLAAAAEEKADPASALCARINALWAELDGAAEWREGTLWWTDRQLELRLNLTALARIAPGHPTLPINVIFM